MKQQSEFELKVIEALNPLPEQEAGEDGTEADFATTAQETFDALQATKGSSQVLAQYPELRRAAAWREIAYFSECETRGTVRSLDIWGADRISQCRVWFDDPGTTESRDGRIHCHFSAPFGPAMYTMTAKFDSNQQASVECKIDANSYGPLGITGLTTQPHPARLGQGNHNFQIEQRYGSFQFLSLAVHAELPQGSRVVPYVLYVPSAVAALHVHETGLVAAWTGDVASGNTYVVSQSPRAGTVVAAGSTVTMRLREGPTP